MKKIGIIGANSYIARNLYAVLSETPQSYDISLYDYTDAFTDGYGKYRKTDIRSKESVKFIDFDCDILYIFAGKTGTLNSFEDYETFVGVNELGLLNIISEYRRQNSSAKIVFPSTRLVYKGSEGLLAENSEKEFKTVYAINKFSCENYLRQYSSLYGVQYCIVRVCVPYGTLVENAASYGTADIMLSKARNGSNITLYGDGSVRRTLTHIRDLCNVLVEGALCEKCIDDVYNIGGEDYSLKEMAEHIAKKYGVGVDFVPYPEQALLIESGSTVFDSTKLDYLLNYKYRHSFKEWADNI